MDGVNTPACGPDTFTQWAADNVDHNVATLSGHNTFYGMGLISMSVQCVGCNTTVSFPSGTFG